jgi:hypothetical protein
MSLCSSGLRLLVGPSNFLPAILPDGLFGDLPFLSSPICENISVPA